MIRAAIALFLSFELVTAGSVFASDAGFKESVEKLKLLYTPAAPAEGQAPALAPPPLSIEAAEDGTLLITQRTETDRSEFRFKSVTEQTWRVHPSDLDPKRVVVQTDPIGVFIPAKKETKRVMVERREAKSRIESTEETGQQWNEHHSFMASYVVLPAASPAQADQAAALIKQIIKTAPKIKQ